MLFRMQPAAHFPQLMQLSLLQAQLEERIQNAQLQMDQKAKLYRDLCVMGSLAAVILLW